MAAQERTDEELAREYRKERFETEYKRGCNSVFIGCWGVVILGYILAYVGLFYWGYDLYPGLLPFVLGTLVVTVVWILFRIYLKKT
jgi:hypothetical protein